MARFFDVHPVTPQPRLINQVVQMVQQDALIAYPTDSGYALGCRLGNVAGVERIRQIRHLDDRHDFTLMCHDFAQMSQFVFVSNKVFRLIKAHTPGSYTFILPATREVPRRFMNPKKRTVGVRISPNPVALALVDPLGKILPKARLVELHGNFDGDVRIFRQGADQRVCRPFLARARQVSLRPEHRLCRGKKMGVEKFCLRFHSRVP